ncbi:unnamed protein product [Paramecium sonneborni]|uniref:Tubulin-tyrosine ligase family protein n=1 Tax=Paramecium sonneborni TaxID=65129 RepID=A0A8S1M7J2_9CILI|nr:unnamed protein product [Paramecium sonneborni]
MRARGPTKDQESIGKSLDNNSVHKRRQELWEKQMGTNQICQGYVSNTQGSAESGIKQFLSSMRKNGSFQQIESQFRPNITENETETPNKSQLKVTDTQLLTPLQKNGQKNQTTYDILSQIYELQNRKSRNQSLLEELMRKTKQANDNLTFQRILQRKKYYKRSQRCQSVAQKEYELEQLKGQLIQVKQVQVQQIQKEQTPKQQEKLVPLLIRNDKTKSPPSKDNDRKKVQVPICKAKKIVIDDTRFWDIGFTKFIQNPSYQEINQIINFCNGIQVIPALHQKYYKLFVGRGNNHMMIKGIFNLRPQWSIANSIDDDTEINFVWTQKFIDLQPSEIKPIPQTIISEEINNWIDSQQMSLIKQAWDKIEGKSKKKLNDYNIDSPPILNNLSNQKELTQLNHQNMNIRIHNHLKGGYQLGDKKWLFHNLSEYCSEQSIDVWNYIPLTYHIHGPTDREFFNFQQTFQHLAQDKDIKNIWIIKPGEDSNRGNGIKVTNQISEIISHISQQGHTFILQKYIENPFLYQKRKFDIRGYCLITIINGVKRVYWYKKGYLRTSSSFFTLESLDNQKIHLTNDAIQNKLNGYGKFEKGNKVSYDQFQAYLIEQNKQNNTSYSFDEIYADMKALTKLATQSAIDKITNEDQILGFELYGLDFMISNNFKPMLIEFNTNPCIETGCPVLTRIITGLLENLMRFIIDPLFPAKRMGNDDFMNKNDFELLLSC